MDRETKRGGLPFLIGGEIPPIVRKEGVNGYICGFNPILFTHCCPCRSDLSDLPGQKKIAATSFTCDGQKL